ncbi:MAG TPA: response regulator [Sphingobium sp.]|uniref:response regulator n=1 Tax=Sphingobium sp. TaxID=1912891 RepID=UPI002ED3C154
MTTVLIVEDELILRQIGAEVLADAGYEVLEAEDAGDAIELLEYRSDIALLFTDVRMPGAMDGLELAQKVHGRWPAIRLLVTSGHIHLSREELPDNGEFLAKPYRWTELTQRVEKLLNRPH